MLTCDRLTELADGYALGALEPEEMAEVEEHSRACADCRERIDRQVEAAALLALAAPARNPPLSLRQSLMAAAREDAAAAEPRRSIWRRLFPEPIRVAWGAASLATLAAAVSVGWALNLQSQVGTPATAAPAAVAAAQTSAAPGGDYGAGASGGFALERAQVKRLSGSDAAPDARGWMYLDPTTNGALLVAYKLPPLPPDRAYQLWLVTPQQQRFSGGVFSVDAEGYGWLKVKSPEAFAQVARVGITVEPKAGSPGPTGQRVLGGEL